MRILAGCNKLRVLKDYLCAHPKHWVRVIITKNGRGKIVDVFVMVMNLTVYFYFRKSINNMVKGWLKRGYPESFTEYKIKKFIYLPKWAWKSKNG